MRRELREEFYETRFRVAFPQRRFRTIGSSGRRERAQIFKGRSVAVAAYPYVRPYYSLDKV